MPGEYLSRAETAKLIRRALKEAFPTIKFSVRSSTYSGGASIRVRWTDGPLQKDVDAIARRFSGASFDGMQDMKVYKQQTFEGKPVSFGADFVFCERSITEPLIATCAKAWEELSGKEQCDIMNDSPGWVRGFNAWQENPGKCLAHVAPFITPKPSKTAESVQLVG